MTERNNNVVTNALQGEGVAVLVPCYNEALTIGKVVDDFRRVLPLATVYVYDNNSTDNTAKIAADHGAVVRKEMRQGKGNAVRSMFRDIEADVYLMVDGDDTYPAEAAPSLISPIAKGECDMTVGDRLSNGSYGKENTRAFHGLGNNLVRGLIKAIYGHSYQDVMTGYRAMSYAFVKTTPIISPGFQIETEVSIWAVDRRWRIIEVPIDYRDRPEGSVSKLSTLTDGMLVLRAIASLFRDYHPMAFFGWLAALLLVCGLAVGVPVILEFQATGLVDKLPSAVLAVGLVLVATLLFSVGLILDTSARNERRQWELDVYEILGERRAH